MILNEFRYEISELQVPRSLTDINYTTMNIIASIRNDINIDPWDVNTHPCANYVSEIAVDIKTWVGKHIRHELIDFRTYPRLNFSYSRLVQRTLATIANNCYLIRMYEEPTCSSLLMPYISGELVCYKRRRPRTVAGSPLLRQKINFKCDNLWINLMEMIRIVEIFRVCGTYFT